jgi:hypothetical protein
MGYGYAVWLVYDQEIFKTEHVAHFTVACFLNSISAFDLTNDIKNKLGKDRFEIHLNGKPEIYSSDYYKEDTTGLFAWGYNGICSVWDGLRNVCNKYDCCFSDIPHTSINYEFCKQNLLPTSTTDKTLSCKLYIADTTSDNPKEWKIIGN